MSAAFKLAAKKKYTQNDLRRIMQETKASKAAAGSAKKVDSPLAKYVDGQLMCVLCKSVVRSEAVWTVHVNAKQHKDNVQSAKQLKEQTDNFTVQSSAGFKRPAAPQNDVPVNKKPKGILKTSSATTSTSISKDELPTDFFDTKTKAIGKSKNFFETTLEKTTIKIELVNIRREPVQQQVPQTENDVEEMSTSQEPGDEEKLPEGFFDDPVKDAKARHQEYRDPNDEEWERFQKEIKEESNVSMAIISEEQEESTVERQITEIDEQIRNWSRVLSLEKRKEEVEQKIKTDQGKVDDEVKENASDEDEEGDFDEYLDWRAKKSHK